MDWKALAEVMEVPLEDRDLPRVVTPLEAMERGFAPLRASIPLDAPMWSPEGGE